MTGYKMETMGSRWDECWEVQAVDENEENQTFPKWVMKKKQHKLKKSYQMAVFSLSSALFL